MNKGPRLVTQVLGLLAQSGLTSRDRPQPREASIRKLEIGGGGQLTRRTIDPQASSEHKDV